MIFSAKKELASGTNGDFFRRLDTAREQLQKVPANVPEHEIVENLLKEWHQREAREHLEAAQNEVISGTDGNFLRRLELAREHLRKIPADAPERAPAEALLKEWREKEESVHLEAARAALKENSYNLAEAHLAHIPDDSSNARTAAALSKQAAVLRRKEERHQAQEAKRYAQETLHTSDSGSVGYYGGSRHRSSGGSTYVRS